MGAWILPKAELRLSWSWVSLTAVISRATLFYTSWQPHHRHQVANPNANRNRSNHCKLLLCPGQRGAQQRMCTGNMERIRQQRQKVKASTKWNFDHIKLLRKYICILLRFTFICWTAICFIKMLFGMQEICLVSWFGFLQGEIILSTFFKFIFYLAWKRSPWIWVNPSSGWT